MPIRGQIVPITEVGIPMLAGEDMATPYLCVYISGDNTIKITTGSLSTVMGIIQSDVKNGGTVTVLVVGKTNVICNGTVTAGDLLIAAASGKVATFTPTASKTTSSNGAHQHALNPGLGTGSSTDIAGAHTHTISITSGEFAGAKIIGKALTGGTNTTISAYINLAG